MIALDASVLFGAVERHGVRQTASKRVVQGLPGPFVTTEACMAEAMHLAGSRGGWRFQEGIWILVASINLSVATTNFPSLERLMRKYRDVPMDLADSTLVALASEDPRVRVATFDSDFLAYRRDDGIPLAGDRLLGWE